MGVIERINQLTKERGRSICSAFGITLIQFLAENMETAPLTREQKEMFDMWATLTPAQKKSLKI